MLMCDGVMWFSLEIVCCVVWWMVCCVCRVI